ncbi:MAG TPA: DUF1697 domain-containing protein [Bryobacteraceae bacterium]|nr:DUF1697 domain-containing protein [Bryobacteraceae bacterium]
MSQKLYTYVALMRGLNMGSRNRIKMPVLEQMFTDATCSDVRSYIQSGNIIFRATPAKAEKIPQLIEARIGELGFRVPLAVRSAAELAGVVERNPFLRAGESEDRLHVLFLSTLPDAASVAALDPERSPGDRFIVQDREIYLQIQSAADSKLTNAWFDSKLKTMCTGRNWRTVVTLNEMMKG